MKKTKRKWPDPVSRRHARTAKKLSTARFVACTAELHRRNYVQWRSNPVLCKWQVAKKQSSTLRSETAPDEMGSGGDGTV